MGWMFTATRRSGRLTPVDTDDDIELLNGFAVVGDVQAFTLSCPGCGTCYEVRVRDGQSRIFNHRTQRFSCRRCRFAVPLRLVLDFGFAPEEPDAPLDGRSA